MNRSLFLITTAVLCLGISSPSRADGNVLWGTSIGAALGGLFGSHFGRGDGRLAATGAGVFFGGLMGNSIGHSLNRANSGYYSRGYAPMAPYSPAYGYYEPTYVAPPSASVVYVQPSITDYQPTQTVYVQEGYVGAPPPRRHGHCREFTRTIHIDGRAYESYGTACLRPDGSWQIER